MNYCGPLGIPYEKFLGWSPMSQEAALEWQTWNRSRCGTCGTNPEDPPGTWAPVTYACGGCRAKHDAAAPPKDQPWWHTRLVPAELVGAVEQRDLPDMSIPFSERTKPKPEGVTG